MSSIQVVFLFDLHACADFILGAKEEFSKRLLYVRLACLRILSDFSAKSPNLKWGLKFFDSHGSKNQTMCKFAFSDMSLENFEILENEICVRYERHISILQALAGSSQSSTSSLIDKSEKEVNICFPVKTLQLALTQVLCEFQWETMDMWSPSYTKIKDKKRNFLFVFSDFKDNDEFLSKYFGLNSSLSKPKFMNAFLPQSLRDCILKKAGIHLVLLNMCQTRDFMGSSSSKILSLLSDTLHSVQGSFIPLCILSQPLYNMTLLNNLEKTKYQVTQSVASNLSCGYQNSFVPFSTLFEQSLHHPFYSSANTLAYKCCIAFATKDLQIPIQIMEISNKKSNIHRDVNVKVANSDKAKCPKRIKWLKFIVQCAVSRSTHFQAYKIILCLSSHSESTTVETSSLHMLNENLSTDGINLLLECITEDNRRLTGLFTPLSNDTSVISILDPIINLLQLSSSSKLTIADFPKYGDFENDSLRERQHFNEKKADKHTLKPFKMECLEPWFKPKNLKVASLIQSKCSNNPMKMEAYENILKQSVKNDSSSKSKHQKRKVNTTNTNESASNSVDQNELIDEKLPDDQTEFQEEISDLSLEELLSAVKNTYNAALEPSGNIVTASKRIIKILVDYSKKSNTCFEESINTSFKDKFLMNNRSIIKKYEMLDSEETRERKIRECQIQILLNLEAESLKKSSDHSNCVNTVTSLLGLASFYYCQDLRHQELKSFLRDVLVKNYNHSLHDVLVEVGDECVQIFSDSESSNSPAETISSEFNNDDELFSSTISSIMSEKSSSSSCSRKDYKDKNALGRKLLHRRSDISDTSRYRQVLLPKSSPKKKKAKIIANKAVRYSPRLAAKRNDEHTRSADEKPYKVRRNLFSGEGACRTPKKSYNQPSTPKSKKKSYVVSKTKLASETPSHKQNYSALQRRKSFIDHLSDPPKVIAESPNIRKTAEDGVTKELFEKFQRISQEASSKPTNKPIQHKPKFSCFKDCTPESKRRLSLKLFSKILCSPTARQGIKKCTKRLFDQISPQKTVESNKKPKLIGECEKPSNSSAKNRVTH